MENLKEELEKLSQDPILSKEFRKKKLIIYLVRTLIAIVIIYFLISIVGGVYSLHTGKVEML